MDKNSTTNTSEAIIKINSSTPVSPLSDQIARAVAVHRANNSTNRKPTVLRSDPNFRNEFGVTSITHNQRGKTPTIGGAEGSGIPKREYVAKFRDEYGVGRERLFRPLPYAPIAQEMVINRTRIE